MTVHPWNSLIAAFPSAHLLQTWEWGQVKSHYGWTPIPILWERTGPPMVYPAASPIKNPAAGALLLRRAIPAGGFAARMRIVYLPKGPLLDWSDAALRGRILDDLRVIGQRQGAIFVKIDPEVVVGTGIPGEDGYAQTPLGTQALADFQNRGWRFSDEQIQFRNTVLIDLSGTEENLLKRMKQKTRYNIHLAERKGVRVRAGAQADLGLLYRMYAETSLRDGFVIRDEEYYRRVWGTFLNNLDETSSDPRRPEAEPLIAEVDGEPVAAAIIFRFAGKAWYLYGMSRNLHRDKMPNYLLQWEAMRRAKAAGCHTYDLWGAPDVFQESDPLWKVYRFKQGLGGVVIQTAGAWDLPLKPVLYQLYTRLLPRLLALMRRRGFARTQRSLAV